MQRRQKLTLALGFGCLGYAGSILLSPYVAATVVFYGAFFAASAAIFVACYYAYRFVYIVDRDRFKRAAELAALADALEERRGSRRSTDRSHPEFPD